MAQENVPSVSDGEVREQHAKGCPVFSALRSVAEGRKRKTGKNSQTGKESETSKKRQKSAKKAEERKNAGASMKLAERPKREAQCKSGQKGKS